MMKIVDGKVDTTPITPKPKVKKSKKKAAKKKTIKSILIPVSKERLSHSSLMKLRDLIFRHPGDCRLKFRIDIDQDNSTTVIAHNRYNVMPEENLLQEMSSLVGDKLMYDV
jgi:DNA polymerase-3 subunit alpha